MSEKLIFIIHSLNMTEDSIQFENQIHQKCYIPGRDTNQNQHGDDILKDNFKAMKDSDENVFCLWDGESYGSLFDMGMAYALGKRIIPISYVSNDKHWKRFFKQKVEDGDSIKFEEGKVNEKN